MSAFEFKLPELGEGVDKGTVAKLLIAPGDEVAAEQGVMEVEIDKATVELPAPRAGKVSELKVKEGDTVTVGQVLLLLEGDGAAGGGKAEEAKAPKVPAEAASAPAQAEADAASPGEQREAAERAGARTAAPPRPQQARPQPRAEGRPAQRDGRPLPAGPAVRRLARMLGVDLAQVSGSGERGRITPDDVHAYLQGLAHGNGGAPAAAPPLPDFSRWGPVREEPLSTVRKRTAEAMTRAWSTIPHVTNHDLCDVTELEAGRKALRAERPDVKLTMTVLAAKACAVALREHPDLNSSIDLRSGEQVLKDYVHIGIAVDTEYGLLVPVLRDVDKKSAVTLSAELTDLAQRTRDKKVAPDELQGATFSISNLGGIGGYGFTPIVNWPQVAILGISRARVEYRPSPQGPVERLILPLSLSYDHRLVDGAVAARFLARLTELLESPARLLVHV